MKLYQRVIRLVQIGDKLLLGLKEVQTNLGIQQPQMDSEVYGKMIPTRGQCLAQRIISMIQMINTMSPKLYRVMHGQISTFINLLNQTHRSMMNRK